MLHFKVEPRQPNGSILIGGHAYSLNEGYALAVTCLTAPSIRDLGGRTGKVVTVLGGM